MSSNSLCRKLNSSGQMWQFIVALDAMTSSGLAGDRSRFQPLVRVLHPSINHSFIFPELIDGCILWTVCSQSQKKQDKHGYRLSSKSMAAAITDRRISLSPRGIFAIARTQSLALMRSWSSLGLALAVLTTSTTFLAKSRGARHCQWLTSSSANPSFRPDTHLVVIAVILRGFRTFYTMI